MFVTAVIPARLGSTRLPRKVLADIHDRPLLWYVWQQVRKARRIDELFVATDAEEVRQAVEGWGGQVLMTSPECRSGTQRIASVLDQLRGDFILNVQGDEPFTDPAMLDALVQRWDPVSSPLVTAVYRIAGEPELRNPNIVKVVRAQDGTALYFSRSPVPFVRDLAPAQWLQHPVFWGHIGVYGFGRDVLAAYPQLPDSRLESAECLEQLRLLEAGYRFQTVETNYRPIAVDTADDLEHVRQRIASGSSGCP
jgi:3-deoxy-manno-octulosonate cytidylyltransferase (CMP-KDO synthetase)